MSERRTYTDEERTHALTLYVDSGAAAAATLTGNPAGTIVCWAHRRGVQRLSPERTRAAIDAMQTDAASNWAEKRANLVYKLADFADAALETAYDRLEAGDLKSAKEGMLAVAIAIDKTQLLTGGATGRHDTEVTVGVRQELLAEGRSRVMELMPPSRRADTAATGTDG
jgi:hypothetical protein